MRGDASRRLLLLLALAAPSLLHVLVRMLPKVKLESVGWLWNHPSCECEQLRGGGEGEEGLEGEI